MALLKGKIASLLFQFLSSMHLQLGNNSQFSKVPENGIQCMANDGKILLCVSEERKNITKIVFLSNIRVKRLNYAAKVQALFFFNLLKMFLVNHQLLVKF